MRLPHRALSYAIFLFIIYAEEKVTKFGTYICPIEFKLAYNKDSDNYVCYKRKEPEEFADKFKDCDGNMYTAKLYRSLNVSKFDEVDRVWADYKSIYPGGPFVSTSEEKIIHNATFIPDYDIFYEKLCLTVNKFGNYTAVRCHEKYYRYCIVKPYPDTKVAMDRTGCRESHKSWRFIGPRELCLYIVTGHGTATPQALCAENGGSLLSKGWQYANFPLFRNISESTLRINPSKLDREKIPLESEDGTCEVVNDTFFDVICEYYLPPRNIFLNLTVESDIILLITNNSLNERNIHCYTNSETYYPTKVKFHEKKKNVSEYSIYELSADSDGHYWCVHVEPDTLQETESQRVLFFHNTFLRNRYAIKIHCDDVYLFENADLIKDNWENRLEAYIFYRTKYIKKYNIDAEKIKHMNITELDLDFLKNNYSSTDVNDAISDIKIRRMYIDMRTILFHVEVRADMIPLKSVKLKGADLLFMKPVHICNAQDSAPSLMINSSILKPGCITYKCVGDFDEGVTLVEEVTPDCVISTSVSMTGLNTEVRNNEPRLMPEFLAKDPDLIQIQALAGVWEHTNLEEYYDYFLWPYSSTTETEDTSTVSSQSGNEIYVEYISLPSLEISSFLDKYEGNITEEFLLELDNLLSKVELEDESSIVIVNDNVGIVISNSASNQPMGLRIAAENSDTFTKDSFSFITDSNYSQHLNFNTSDTVVILPPSIINSQSRISFVVFRDNYLFRDITSDIVVNSRIVTVQVNNYTNFEEGEVIDIYMKSLSVKPWRSYQACGYWKFVENATGHWGTDGCTFIGASRPDDLNVCRCTHLTHFAEILIPRTNFSKTHEIILQVLSIVGCILSIIGLMIIATTAAVFESWRRDSNNKIWLQLCLGIFFFNISFLVTIFAKFDESSVWCIATGIALHYSVLSSFIWMVAAAIRSYKKLVLLFSTDISLLKYTIVAWGTPIFVISTLISLDFKSYAQPFNEKTLSGVFCYPSGYGLIFTVYTPILIMLVINWTLFVLILIAICKSSNIRKHGNSISRDALRNAIVSSLLIFLFGLPWITGLTAQFILCAYIFTVSATLQGFVLFIFFILANRKTRNLWIRKLNLDKSVTLTEPNTRSERIKDYERNSHELKMRNK